MPKVKMAPFDRAKADRERRRAEWRRRAESSAAEQRSKRLEAIEASESAVNKAMLAYRELPYPDTDVQLRAGCIRIDPERPLPPELGGLPWPAGMDQAKRRAHDLETRQPLARLVGKKGNALNTYVAMIYTLHAERTTSDRHPLALTRYGGDVPWSTLCGRHTDSPRARHERMKRDVAALSTAKLLTRVTSRRGEPDLRFLDQWGSENDYSLPIPGSEDLISLPAAMFRNGWHLVLTPQELIMWITINDAYAQMRHDRAGWAEDGVPLTQHVRWSRYGISGETYEALHELAEFGLIAVHDPMSTRERGKFTPPSPDQRAAFAKAGHAFSPEPYQLRPMEHGFGSPAVQTVYGKLESARLPPRMTSV